MTGPCDHCSKIRTLSHDVEYDSMICAECQGFKENDTWLDAYGSGRLYRLRGDWTWELI